MIGCDCKERSFYESYGIRGVGTPTLLRLCSDLKGRCASRHTRFVLALALCSGLTLGAVTQNWGATLKFDEFHRILDEFQRFSLHVGSELRVRTQPIH